MRTVNLFALVTFFAATLSTPVAAEQTRILVPYSDLDLATNAGMKELAGRIEGASRRICGQVEVRRLHDGIDYDRCVQQTHASVTFEVAKRSGNEAVLALNATR